MDDCKKYRLISENVANGLANPQKNVAALRNVPGHRCFSFEYGNDRRTLVSST